MVCHVVLAPGVKCTLLADGRDWVHRCRDRVDEAWWPPPEEKKY